MATTARRVPRHLRGGLPRWGCALVAVGLLAAACGQHKVAAQKKVAAAAPPSPSASPPAPSPSPSPAPPATCPLTGQVPAGGVVPNRPALAIKVENSPQSRPPYGLDSADVIFEEPVEGGITRFVVFYQCHDAARVEPVRSVRQADIYIVNLAGKSLFGNAGGSPPTLAALDAAVKAGWTVNVGYDTGGGYHRDPNRAAPHNLYTSTAEIYGRPDAKIGGTANPIFTYSASPAPGGPGSLIHVDFSQYSDVYWHWVASAGAYQRYYGSTPANLANGGIISAQNVVIQSVPVTMSWWIEDPSGSHQPVPTLLGTGAALVCRQGTCVTGTWWRPGEGLSQLTYYRDAAGNPIALAPGVTWVELVPSSVTGPGPIPVGSYSAQ